MKKLLLESTSQMGSILYSMCLSKEWTKNIFIASEKNFFKCKKDLDKLISEGYISLTRKGQKGLLKILTKGQKEAIEWTN